LRNIRNPLAAASLPLLLTLAGSGCRGSIDAFASSPAAARQAADHAFAGFAYRFYNVSRDSAFERARNLMAQYALIPSRIYRDSTLWNATRPDSSRTLIVRAAFAGDSYRFAADRAAPLPRALGDERHALTLKWLGGGDYEWTTHVDHAIGPATPAGIAAAIVATLTAAEGRPPDESLRDARAMFPATGRQLAQLFSVDSLRTAVTDGATTTTLALSFHPSRLRPKYTFLANYVGKYIMPTIYSMQLTDHAGRAYVDVDGRDGKLVIRLRSRNRRLVSLDGAPVAIPDSLRLRADVSFKYGMFRVGVTDLVGDFTIERSDRERSWVMRFRREPAWHFPLAVDKLIRNPLRRPFQGRGIEFTLGARDDLTGQTMSVRQARVVVNESAIMRWLGRLGANAFGDFSGRTELEENLFLYEMFEALRKDGQ
jgi:hypothetical protein